ncbi:hypothetical protein [Geodermatophilus sp. URMC 62]|uniref:hypothetical protein n=1 Tax=Geodermatophilus sp. URMC 62 TaxID=3423414 RepID=UPI00406C76AA
MLTAIGRDGRGAGTRCTPVIGAGASASIVPGAATLARAWADEYDHPLAVVRRRPRPT